MLDTCDSIGEIVSLSKIACFFYRHKKKKNFLVNEQNIEELFIRKIKIIDIGMRN